MYRNFVLQLTGSDIPVPERNSCRRGGKTGFHSGNIPTEAHENVPDLVVHQARRGRRFTIRVSLTSKPFLAKYLSDSKDQWRLPTIQSASPCT